MTAYYNEIDPYCAAWLQNLMDAGHIAKGVIDTRSIEDVRPDELAGYTQCHFFAGIGVWSLALRSAGWSDSRPAWTGSCPCQPFSAAGKGAGFADERHLWPAWQHIINQCRPERVFGEQVASKAVGAWIDLVHADLEGMDYAFGCVPFPSAGVGAPNPRERAYWVADTMRQGLSQRIGVRRVQREEMGTFSRQATERRGVPGGMADTNRDGRFARSPSASSAGYGSAARPAGSDDRHNQPSPTNGHWRAADWLGCTDGKWRPVEPGTFPLAHGASSRVGRLCAYGNAINAISAQAFIESYIEARGLN